ncbi:hypothetical protein P5673_026711 [Acropora cervicornis]|uniref:Uncharacterized protein n=1 Tax=Acropora cervicornis TaxID=6130 RepID=A0AAD9PZY1_ACRCE|nr:hypothetical protein P5673_026711 [Acropora cervicornis]
MTKYSYSVRTCYSRHLKIDVYRGPQTSTGHVTRLQSRVYGKFFTFSTARETTVYSTWHLSVGQNEAMTKPYYWRKPERPVDWEDIALNLSLAFSTPNNAVEIKGQACRERSGTEEAYSEIKQVLQEILDYRRDINQEKIDKKRKAEEDRKKGEDMRRAALDLKKSHAKGQVRCQL